MKRIDISKTRPDCPICKNPSLFNEDDNEFTFKCPYCNCRFNKIGDEYQYGVE